MKRSTERILTTHAGSLPRPEGLREIVVAKGTGQPYDEGDLSRRLRSGVADVVRLQIESGLDIVNDGELSKPSFTDYARERIGGLEKREMSPEARPAQAISGRDQREFPEYFASRVQVGAGFDPIFCSGPLSYTGQAAIQADIDNFNAALQGASPVETFLPSVAPGTIEHWLRNEHYASDEAFLNAIADVMHKEYKAIVGAGFLLQIDDPDLGDAWQIHGDMDVPEYRKFAELRIEALYHALREIPQEKIRFHMCWGSYHGPHLFDIPLRDIIDLVLKVRAEAYSI